MSDPPRDEKAIFLAALGHAIPEAQRAYAESACAGDTDLFHRVSELLAAHSDSVGPLDRPPLDVAPALIDHPLETSSGTVIGPYKLAEQIGEGGFGVVWMAEQTVPVKRQVALKVIKPGMDTRQVIARFEAERQALALMDHPHIAKVLDAGATETGRPYFVMELVRGTPITRYCDDNRLTTRQRLELFMPVCQAIQHAHLKGIIHRDLKPSNVLVAECDGLAVPKIIDFGVAKAVGGKLTDKSMFTQQGQLLGTLEYMSPEQAKLNPFDVDTRTDVYALGVLLYELLTGTTPFSHERLQAAAFDEMLRILREEEPQKPSSRLTTIDDLPSVAANRQIEPARLSRLVRGELDWIVMKALEKDRNRRYETANGFACDVQRYLADEPVQACPPSAGYRLYKLARRNKATVVAAGLILISLIGGVVGTTWQAVRATRERNEKEQARRESVANERRAVTAAARAQDQEALAQGQRDRADKNFRLAQEAVDQMLTRVADDMAGKPHMEQIRRELLVDALKFYQGFLKQKGGDPYIRHETARAYLRVGRIHMLLGQLEEAETPLREALAMMQQLVAEFPDVIGYRTELADAENALTSLFSDIGIYRPTERLEHALAAFTVRKELAAEFPDRPEMRRRLAEQFLVVGVAYGRDVDARESERFLREGVAAWEALQVEFPEDQSVVVMLSRAHHWLGWLFLGIGRLGEAEAELRRELAIRATLAKPEPYFDSMTKAYLAEILMKTGRPEEAEPLIREVIAYREKGLESHPDYHGDWRRLCIEYSWLSECLDALGRADECEQPLRRGLEIAQKLATDFRGITGESGAHALAWKYYDLGLVLHETGRIAEAAELFREAQLRFEDNAVRTPSAAGPVNSLAWFLADCPAVQFRDPLRSIELAQRALELVPQSSRYWNTLGVAQAGAGQWQAANDSIEKSIELSSGGQSGDWFLLAKIQWHMGNQEQARAWYDRAVHEMETNRFNRKELLRHQAEAAALFGITDSNPLEQTSSAEPIPDC